MLTTHKVSDYLDAIQREIGKRRTTYPKIIAKQQKKWRDNEQSQSWIESETIKLATTQRLQFELLQMVAYILEGIEGPYNDRQIQQGWLELHRELEMRKKSYPRWVLLKRMDPETAKREIRVWEQLEDYFLRTYYLNEELQLD